VRYGSATGALSRARTATKIWGCGSGKAWIGYGSGEDEVDPAQATALPTRRPFWEINWDSQKPPFIGKPCLR
jgi:hypothetical protein